MKILSWFKKREQREDTEAVQRAQGEYFDTPEERRMESGDMEAMHADTRAGLFVRDNLPEASEAADPEERLAEEEER